MAVDYELVHLAHELARAEEHVEELRQKIAALVSIRESTVGEWDKPINPNAYQYVLDTSVPVRGKISAAIARLLRDNPADRFNVEEIAKHCGASDKYVRKALARLKKRHVIQSRGVGFYGAFLKPNATLRRITIVS